MARVLAALGGNALSRPGGTGDWAEAILQMRATAPTLVEILRDGHELILTHGNGPQVGQLLRQNELSAREVPARPMHVLGAETQGQIGYLIAQELTPALQKARITRTVLPWVCRVAVAARDPAFRTPSKPVGRLYDEAESRILRKREGWIMHYDGGRGGWRRVVPSPSPVKWVEAEAFRTWIDQGLLGKVVPVVTGGGGIPVVERAGGMYEGIDAVIDKDLTAAMVAAETRSDTLAIVTDVPAVAIGYKKPWERWISEVTLSEIEPLLARGEFGEGSMRPKVQAGLNFLRAGGRRVIITDIPSLSRALQDEAGTRIIAG
jgi:carbamate kinase